MSIRLPLAPVQKSAVDDDGLSESSSSDQDETWEDWVDDSPPKPCRSLFDDSEFPSVDQTIAYDKSTHGFDLGSAFTKMVLDIHGRIRLINFIRKHKVSPKEVSTLTGKESFFSSDDYLIPVLEDDPLLQWQPDDWSDSEDEDEVGSDPIQVLEKKLAATQKQLEHYRIFAGSVLAAPLEASSSGSKPAQRDDDTHYFDSYAENDIHAVMIQDQVRTSTYASFILEHPALFKDAVVLDVGCGTGILSLFAARAGARKVIAVDASDIAKKAEKIIKANGYSDVIEVIQGKVEDITLPEGITHVDIIVSEWMGYALLYESMLDSVLVARDRFLKRGEDTGIMAPSQCQMMLALCDASEVRKDRVDFWGDIYGFDLSTMAEDVFDNAIIDVVGPESLLSEPYVVKDLLLSSINARQLSFASSFTLTSTAAKRTKLNSFVLYFDTFFNASGAPISPSTKVKVTKEQDPVVAEVWPVGGKPAPKRRQSLGKDKENVVSFSTGPQSIPTHWKQTIFLLREPVKIEEGSVVSGTFYCKKSENNSRSLDVEIHYCVQRDAESPIGETVVAMYKVE
ncbi:Protein arginine N-methyltransferase 3-like C2H2 zinc finger domain-containing protein [Pleurotus pulmonarius]|nr:hypothetical protein EYR36_005427 [Pleurotus pulmonarius]